MANSAQLAVAGVFVGSQHIMQCSPQAQVGMSHDAGNGGSPTALAAGARHAGSDLGFANWLQVLGASLVVAGVPLDKTVLTMRCPDPVPAQRSPSK